MMDDSAIYWHTAYTETLHELVAAEKERNALKQENGALREMNLSRIKWGEEQDEVIAYARTEIQAMVGCQGWEDTWCPTSCRWWKVCQPMEERCE